MSGSSRMACASSRRCFMPPERLRIVLPRTSDRPTAPSAQSMRSSARARGMRRSEAMYSRKRSAVKPG